MDKMGRTKNILCVDIHHDKSESSHQNYELKEVTTSALLQPKLP